ncbi:hypothetical protein MYSTI_04164 [Myxococcus stipitatus DSM 14675]|uniref:Uncharacterized protein n=1 Tax=Myxococcus stipitatus (strain DSM 14675 / JCM 12634 / Mx s8) TaxID=1278073 RepID=L7UGB2_MYXSD|nr:hypothetical protein [Myxococcus stipitatus]AGC45464.1 hypothetical protein MYSTI_04164 [Myxococcus stipitatus DSM 14675]
MTGIGKILFVVVTAVCALAGGYATFGQEGALQVGANQAAQMCEAAGIPAYLRGPDGQVIPRPQPADEGPRERRVGLTPRGGGLVPLFVPAPGARSTVQDVGPADTQQ